jgi:hypothetical protein
VTTIRALLSGLALVALAACHADPASNQGVAERFLDAHYVRIDLAAAQALTTGVAQKKVEEERRLVAGQEIDESTRKPSVYYRLLEEHPDGLDRSRMVYRATFSASGTSDIERRILLVLRRDDGVWRVANFEEFE